MSRLSEWKIKGVSSRILKTLEKDGWDAKKLARAQGEDLTHYSGLGKAFAWRLIVEARRRTRDLVASQPIVPVSDWLTPQPDALRGLYLAPPEPPPPPWLNDMSTEAMVTKFRAMAPGEEIPAMSVRVRRAWLRKRIIELSR